MLSKITAEDARKHASKVREIITSKHVSGEGIVHINKLADFVEDHGNGYLIARTLGGKIDMTLVHAMDTAFEKVFGENLTAQYMAMEIRTALRELSQAKHPTENLRTFVNSLVAALQ